MEELKYTKEDVAVVRKYFQVTEETIKENVAILKNWLEQQRHLPKNQDDGFLERLLLRNKFRIEQTKQKLDGYYTIRGIHREYYQENNSDIVPSRQIGVFLPLSRLTPKSERIILYKVENDDPELYNILNIMKFIMLVLEILMRNDYSIGDRFLVDMKGLSMAHLTKISIASVSHFNSLYIKAYSARPLSLDFINCPTYVNVLMKVLKMGFSEKLFSKVKLHDNLESLYETYPKECMPSDYGGKLESFKEIKEKWDVVFEKNQKLFDACYHDVSQENLRVGDMPKSDYFGVDGTFKKLTLD